MRHLSRSQRVLYLFVDSSIYSKSTKTRWDVSLATPWGRAVRGLSCAGTLGSQPEASRARGQDLDEAGSVLFFSVVSMCKSFPLINQSFNQ